MARPLSKDLRVRIVRAVEAGSSRREAADQFAVSVSCAVKLMQRWEQTGSVTPAAMGGKRPFALAGHEELLRRLLAARPDASLDELRERLADHGVAVGRSSIHRFMGALGLTRKKRHSMPPSKNVPTLRTLGQTGGTSSLR